MTELFSVEKDQYGRSHVVGCNKHQHHAFHDFRWISQKNPSISEKSYSYNTNTINFTVRSHPNVPDVLTFETKDSGAKRFSYISHNREKLIEICGRLNTYLVPT